MQKSDALGFAVAAVVGAVVLVVVGYFVYATPGGAVSFGYWLHSPVRFGALNWAFAGILAGVAVRYLSLRR